MNGWVGARLASDNLVISCHGLASQQSSLAEADNYSLTIGCSWHERGIGYCSTLSGLNKQAKV
jgi:hypothetical protein